jgi:hypothetical protein
MGMGYPPELRLKMRNLLSVVAGLVALAACLSARCAAEIAEDKVQVASVLSGEFASVFYANSKPLLEEHLIDSKSIGSEGSLERPFSYLYEAYAIVPGHLFKEILKAGNGVFVGAKDFRRPEGSLGLGDVRSRRCYVVLLKNAGSFDIALYLRRFQPATLIDRGVWRWSAHIDEFGPEAVDGMPMGKPKTSSIYSRQIGNRFLLLSNDLEEMKIVSDRLVVGSQGHPTQDEIQEWGEITQNQLWGYRLYEHNADLDKVAAGTQEVSPGTKAIACFLRPDRKALTVRVFTSSAEGEETIRRLNSEKLFPLLEPIGNGTWESEIPTSDGAALNVAVGLFGFIIYS